MYKRVKISGYVISHLTIFFDFLVIRNATITLKFQSARNITKRLDLLSLEYMAEDIDG